MAEILLLLIFLLMLLLAAKLIAEKKTQANLAAQRDAAVQELLQIKPVVEALKQSSGENYDIAKDYVKIKQSLEAANVELEKSRQTMQLLEEIKKNSPKMSDKDANDLLK